MSKDVILYEKQKQKFAKALGKAQDALSELFVVANEIGVSPVGPSETSAASTDAEPAAKETEAKSKKKGSKSKADKQPVVKANGGAFAEM